MLVRCRRMRVGLRGMAVCGSRVLLSFLMIAGAVMVRSLQTVMRGGLMMRGGLVMVRCRRMRFGLCHREIPPLDRMCLFRHILVVILALRIVVDEVKQSRDVSPRGDVPTESQDGSTIRNLFPA